MSDLRRLFEAPSQTTGITFCDRSGEGELHTYAALVARAGGAAREMARRGVRPGDRVAMLLDASPASVACLLGAWLAGATVVSVPPPPRRRLGGDLAFLKAGMAAAVAPGRARLLVGPRSLGEALGRDSVEPEALDVGPAAPPTVELAEHALVQYTSGSSGAPKGVAVSARALAGHCLAIGETLGMDPETDRTLSWLPLYHDMGLVGFLLTPLACGLPLWLTRPSTFVRDPSSWLRLCGQHRITSTGAPDFAYRATSMVLSATADRDPGDLSPLRICMSGAERISHRTLQRFAEVTAPYGLDEGAIMPVYGMAETTLAVTLPPVGRGPVVTPDGSVGLGTPIRGLELRVNAPDGERGTVSLRGEWLFDGYETADGPIRPFDADGWFETNDVGSLHEGELHVHGRVDETVIARGRNVFAEDVEQLAALQDALLPLGVAAFRAPGDDGRFSLAMEVVAEEGTDLRPHAREIQGAITANLGVKVSPVVFLAPRALPRTTSGKVKRAECRRAQDGGLWPDGAVLAEVA